MNKEKNWNLAVSEESKNLVDEMAEINEQLKVVKAEKEKLDKYLATNIFNYVEAKEGLEEVFQIKNNALTIFDSLDRGYLQLERTIPLLEVRHLTKYYQGEKIPAVVNASFKVYPGDFHVLVGASGSGKTTILKAILNHSEFDGEILVANKVNTKEQEETWKPLIGVVDQNSIHHPQDTLETILVQKVQERALSRLRASSYVRNALQEMNLWHARNKRFITLGLLEKRKLELAIALINQPNLVILDEPLTGLQQHEKVELLILLAKLQKENRGVLVLSHLVDEFSGYANFITVLAEGRIYYSGLIENLELYNLNKYNIKTSDNALALSVLKKINCHYRFNEVSDSILVRFDGQLNLLLFQKECAAKNIVISDLRHAAVSLEDLYGVLLKVGTGDAIRKIHEYKKAQRQEKQQ